tara:strand:- start:127 stop:333 length:207 start_codon:yes stop_codon:yes gene_type:complete
MEIELRGWLDKRVKKKKNYFSISLGSSKTLSNFASAFRTRGRKKRGTEGQRGWKRVGKKLKALKSFKL